MSEHMDMDIAVYDVQSICPASMFQKYMKKVTRVRRCLKSAPPSARLLPYSVHDTPTVLARIALRYHVLRGVAARRE